MWWSPVIRTLAAVAAVLASVLAGSSAEARIGPPVDPAAAPPTATTDYSEVALVSDVAAVRAGEPFWLALVVDTRPGWHTYWENPGDSGLPTQIDWTLPDGYAAGPIAWPAPERLPVGPLMNYGYSGGVVLLTRVTPPQTLPADGVPRVVAEARWLVCEEICVPEEATLGLTVGADPQTVDPARIAAARGALPPTSPWPARVGRDGDAVALRIDVPGLDPERLLDAYFFPAGFGVFDAASPQTVTVDPGGVTLSGRWGGEPLPGTVPGVLTLEEWTGDEAIRRSVALEASSAVSPVTPAAATPIRAPAPTPPGGAAVGWPEALLLAALGGLILNLMPCVFPILSMKAIGLAALSAADGRAARRHGRLYALGVLACFVAVAGALIALRGAGGAVGWGFQLQEPAVVGVLALVMFGIGLNLAGVFEIGGGWIGLGSRWGAHGGDAGAFLTGALAVVVATPCTAPFMGVALGFALVQPWPLALAVFLALGAGMALPYLVLTHVPALHCALPRPGPWMARLRQLLAFPMFATAVWLVWVLSQQAGPTGVLASLGAMVLAAFAIWLWQVAGGLRPIARAAGRLGAAASGVAALVAVLWLAGPPPRPAAAASPAPSASGLAWEPYSDARLSALRGEGRPVLVNFTAAWCITCLVNERVAFDDDTVRAALATRGVAVLKGDWTLQDPEITAALARFGRSSVPLYLLYPGEGGEPEVLPQILTADGVAAAVARL